MSDVGPHCYKKMRVKVTYNGVAYVLGMVDVSEMELLREGGVEAKYGKDSDSVLHGGDSSRRHKVGMKRMRFRLRRWFKTDGVIQRGLLFMLHDGSLSFDLEEYVPRVTIGLEWSGIKISNCISYSYRQVGGTANDIAVEEIQGEGTTHESSYSTPAPCVPAERVVNGDFETGDFTGWNFSPPYGSFPLVQVTTTHYGGSYGARLVSYTDNMFVPYGTEEYFEQTLALPMLVSNITSFGFWYLSPNENLVAKLVITYSDTSTTIIGIPSCIVWTYKDVLPLLSSGKTIVKIRFRQITPCTNCYIDDVSLIGC